MPLAAVSEVRARKLNSKSSAYVMDLAATTELLCCGTVFFLALSADEWMRWLLIDWQV